MRNTAYKENSEPIQTGNYKDYHIRYYIVGSAIDVNIYDFSTKCVLTLCDFQNMKEAKSMVKVKIDELI